MIVGKEYHGPVWPWNSHYESFARVAFISILRSSRETFDYI